MTIVDGKYKIISHKEYEQMFLKDWDKSKMSNADIAADAISELIICKLDGGCEDALPGPECPELFKEDNAFKGVPFYEDLRRITKYLTTASGIGRTYSYHDIYAAVNILLLMLKEIDGSKEE